MEHDLRQNKVLSEIKRERWRQDQKWGVQNHDDPFWYVILGEEFGEVGEAIFEGDESGVREELIQVAAVALAHIECIDRRKRGNN